MSKMTAEQARADFADVHPEDAWSVWMAAGSPLDAAGNQVAPGTPGAIVKGDPGHPLTRG